MRIEHLEELTSSYGFNHERVTITIEGVFNRADLEASGQLSLMKRDKKVGYVAYLSNYAVALIPTNQEDFKGLPLENYK